ncbi:hypothetical protein NHQ30_007134 [Ciborinia camelliae]|nr:hypothetical protein NHQ30_007134 [Ciborinia camelliae]
MWGSEPRKRLADLRLVSKAFCSAASPRLFRHIVVWNDSYKSLGLARLLEISNSPYANYVRYIDIKFSFIRNATMHLFVEDFAGLLPCCLPKFPNLNALDFHKIPSSLIQGNIKSLINTFVMGLRYVPLVNLTELEVTFQTTDDFKQFFSKASSLRIPIEHVLQNLRHLVYQSETTIFAGRCSIGDFRFPNDKHANYLSRLVELATNLDSLTIRCTDIVNLDTIRFPCTMHLESLCLSSVAIPSEKFLALIEQSKESIRIVELWLVKLNSGTWQDILLPMSELLHLIDFQIESSGYSLTGMSSHLADELIFAPDASKPIETHSWSDYEALVNLQGQVNANRVAAGLSPFSAYEYRYPEQYVEEGLSSSLAELILGEQNLTYMD